MIGDVLFEQKSKTPIYIQITERFILLIEQGILLPDTLLPSVRDFKKKYNVSKDTVERAYLELKKRGYIDAILGKGYFVSSSNGTDALKILCVLNNFSLFKQKIYYSFIHAMGDRAKVDFQVYNYNPFKLKEIVEKNLWKFDYFVVTPFFEADSDPDLCLDILKMIPENKLVLVDRFVPNIICYKAVFQDFQNDIFDALTEVKPLVLRYHSIAVLLPTYKHQLNEVVESGLTQFGEANNIKIKTINNISALKLSKGTVYITLSDEDLVLLLLKIRRSNFKVGVDIGIISYNESELKDLLDITVISTNFKKMGETAAQLVLKNENALIKNPCRIIKRGSL